MPRTKKQQLNAILKALPGYRERMKDIKDILLANLVMIAEIPAPTFAEQERVVFLEQRFSEVGLLNTSSDEKNNALAILPGTGGEEKRNILVVAHVDTLFPESVDHTISVLPDRVCGPGVADNSLGLAVMISLPQILELLNIELQANLVLMGAARSLGRGNLDGLRFFLANNSMPFCAGVCVEGVPLGRLNTMTIGMMRGEITCRVPEEYDWTRFGASGAIISLNEVLNKILEIPLPRKPRTAIVLGSIEGGTSFNTVATHSRLQFEIRSESAKIVHSVSARIQEICAAVSSETDAEVTLDVVAEREPGGIPFEHPLPTLTRSVMNALDIPLRAGPSTSELSSFIERNIPAITVGITSGEAVGQIHETVHVEPIFTGVAQLLGILLAIDGGHCHDDR